MTAQLFARIWRATLRYFGNRGTMASPTVNATLDKQSYAPGDTVTLTVTYADADNKTSQVTITGHDAAGNPATISLSLVVADAVTLSVTDDGARTWAKVSDTGAVAVFTTTA